jgi:hypothetical protein
MSRIPSKQNGKYKIKPPERLLSGGLGYTVIGE